jgi:GNAT superfamily N-acetyltransferase
MSTFKIRNTNPQDVSLILQFIKEIAEYEKLSHEVVTTEKILMESLFGEKKSAEVVIGEFEDKPVGYAIYFYNFSTFLGKKGLYLEDLFVKPEYRGKGFGKELLLHLVKIAKDQNCGRMEWSVLNWNKPAIEFYQSLGAKPMGGWTVYRLDTEALNNLLPEGGSD